LLPHLSICLHNPNPDGAISTACGRFGGCTLPGAAVPAAPVVVRYVLYSAIVGTHSDYQQKQGFRPIDLDLDDGSRVRLKVVNGHGKLRDAFAVWSCSPAVFWLAKERKKHLETKGFGDIS
jgi:hypothetical protein